MSSKPTRDSITALFTSFAGQSNSLVIPRPYVDFCKGDILAALLLSQILYWAERTEDKSGWFAKSYGDWNDELGMTEYQIKRAIHGDKRRKNNAFSLSDVGVETDLKQSKFYHGAATIHYRVNTETLRCAILEFLGVPNNVQNEGKADLDNVQNGPRTMFRTAPEQCSERSTETTTETTDRDKAAAASATAAGESPDKPPEGTPRPNVFVWYEDATGLLIPKTVAEELRKLETEYPEDWLKAAFKQMGLNHARSLNYAKAILERWEREGKDNGRRTDTRTEPAGATGRARRAEMDANRTQASRRGNERPRALTDAEAAAEAASLAQVPPPPQRRAAERGGEPDAKLA